MNEANVKALYAILRVILRESIPDVTVLDVAVQLAARGVLVPSVLTDKEEEYIASVAETPSDLRPLLESIAKGGVPVDA